MSHKMLKWTILFIVITTILTIQAIPVVDEKELEKVQSCKTLCGHCGCTGFYCGDECICECNNQEDEDITCVSLMKSNCQKLRLPFEVLIQGPSGNRFVRDLIETDPEHKPIDRKTRSTLSIYKPVDDEEKIENFLTNNKLQIKINKQQKEHDQEQSAVDRQPHDNNKVDEPIREQKFAEIVNAELSLDNDAAIEYENKDSTFVFESINRINEKNMEHQRPKQIIDELTQNHNKDFEFNSMQKRQAPGENEQAVDEVVGAAAPSEQVAASNDQVAMVKKDKLFDKIKLKEKFLTMHKKLELAKPLELKKAMAFKEIGLSKKPLKLKLEADKLKLLGMEKKLAFEKMLGSKKKLGHEKFLLGKPLKFGGDKIVGDSAVVGDTLVGAAKSDDHIIVQPAHTQ